MPPSVHRVPCAGVHTGPDFLCIGAQKAGTQWLYDQLQHHADFWMPPIKEFHYFDRRPVRAERAEELRLMALTDLESMNRERASHSDREIGPQDVAFLEAYARLTKRHEQGLFGRMAMAGSAVASRILPGYGDIHRRRVWPALQAGRRPDFGGYARLFAGKGACLSGDITPAYSILPAPAVQVITEALPGLKIVFLVRDPVERFWSAVAMHARKRMDGWPENRHDLERLLRRPDYFNRSYATEIVARWQPFVRKEDFGVFLFDDLLADAAGFRRRVLAFLGGDPDKPSGRLPPGFNRKERGLKRPLSAEQRKVLGQLFADELRASARVFGGAATEWPAKYGV
jgi:hypothetical protein